MVESDTLYYIYQGVLEIFKNYLWDFKKMITFADFFEIFNF